MTDPIVCLIASYKEGALIQGAIRSALKATPHVIVFEGPTEGIEIEGADDTNLGPYTKYLKYKGNFESETVKRNAMLDYARMKNPVKPFWILTLDADEIIVWPEFLIDWLGLLRPGYPQSSENIAALKRTEAAYRPDMVKEIDGLEVVTQSSSGLWTDLAPSRCVHSSLVKRYDVGCWRIETPDGNFGTLDHIDAEHPPLFGEPHIHHRAYMRRPERRVLRLHEGEEKRWMEQNLGSNVARIADSGYGESKG